jgi:type IX secretion system PorP/SprF family membrane protein
MRIGLTFLLFIALQHTLSAQQAPQYSHYVFNQFQLNPAVAGSKPCLDLRFGFRNQWAGFGEGPKTQFGSIHSAVGRKSEKSTNWHGLGVKFETDQAARFRQSMVALAYAYHFQMTREMYASVGLFVGFNQYRVDLTNAIFLDPNDVVFENVQAQNLLVPDVTPGFWMHNDDFFLGISVKHIVGNTLLESTGDPAAPPEAKLRPHFNLTTGKAYEMSKTVNFIPSLRLSYVSAAPLAFDVNAFVDFDNTLALGLGYRNGDALIGMFKLNFMKYFTLGYAYDFTISDMSNVSNSTHEVMLGIIACPSKSGGRHTPCAAYD